MTTPNTKKSRHRFNVSQIKLITDGENSEALPPGRASLFSLFTDPLFPRLRPQHSLYPHTWHFRHPSMFNSVLLPQSGHKSPICLGMGNANCSAGGCSV